MLDKIADLGPWVLSSVALVQVWAIALWRKLRTGRVGIHESGTIELGFSNFGPTVALIGTLQAQHRDVFVKKAAVCVVRMKDGATHHFEWRAFRPRTVSLDAETNRELELPSSFLVQPTSPFRYNIFFVDEDFIATHKDAIDPLQKEWYEFRTANFSELEAEFGERVREVAEDPRTVDSVFAEFSRQQNVVDAYSRLDRAFYWEPGEYGLELKIECGDPNKTFRKEWALEISQEETDGLRLNSVATLRSVCGLGAYFHFAYPRYQTKRELLPERTS